MKKFIFSILFSISFLFAQSEAGGFTPTIYWVDMHNGSDDSSGTSQAKAFETVQKALQGTSLLHQNEVDTIKVMPSVISGSPNGYYDFGDSEITNIGSGYDFVLIGVAGPDSTIFDAESKNRHMTLDDGQSNKSIIQGITFRNGKSDSYPDAGSISISNSTNIQFINCVWKNNSSSYGSNGGGAINIRYKATPSFDLCVFESNFVNVTDNSTNGGAISIEEASSNDDLNSAIKIYRSKFLNNYAKAKYTSTGGAITSRRSLDIQNSLFVNNGSISNNGGTNNPTFGGAISLDNYYYNNGYVGGTTEIINSTFHGNYIKSVSSSVGDMIGSTISYGQWNEAGSKTFIFNTIITGSKALVTNDDTDFYGMIDDLYSNNNGYSSTDRKWYKQRLVVG